MPIRMDNQRWPALALNLAAGHERKADKDDVTAADVSHRRTRRAQDRPTRRRKPPAGNSAVLYLPTIAIDPNGEDLAQGDDRVV